MSNKNVVVDITSRERIYINPNDGTRLSGLTKGVIPASIAETDLGEGGETSETTSGGGAPEENQA